MTAISLKQKEYTYESLDDLNSETIKKCLEDANQNKVHIAKFSFGTISKVTFDVIIYKD